MHKNIDEIFDFAFKNIVNLEKVCDGILGIAQNRKKEFRLIFQIATSPQYGNHIREYAEKLDAIYKQYTEALSKKLDISFDELYPYINLCVYSFVDCVIWDEWDKLKLEFNCILKSIANIQK